MESSGFSDLLEELNRTEKEYEIKSKQYVELRSIILQDAHGKSDVKSTSSKDNVSKKVMGCNSGSEQGKIVSDGDASSLKATVKNRIREYHSLKSNMEKFKCNSKEKVRFMEALRQDNRDILTGLHVDSIDKLIDAIQQ